MVWNHFFSGRRKKSYDNNPITRMLMNSKSRAYQNNIEFDITLEDVPIPKYCPILEIKLQLGTAKNYEIYATEHVCLGESVKKWGK